MFVFRPNERPKGRRPRFVTSQEALETRDMTALVVAVDAPKAPVGEVVEVVNTLQVQAIQRRGLHSMTSRFTIVFNQPVSLARGTDPANYLLLGEGPDLSLGTLDDEPVRLRRVVADASGGHVTLVTARPVPLVGREYVVAIDGNRETGVIAADGDPLDGNQGPGTDVFRITNVQDFVPPRGLTRAIRTPSGKGLTPPTGIIRNG